MMIEEFRRLFQAGKIGNMTVDNRLIQSPYGKNYCNKDGTVTQRYIDYMVERAKSGIGLIIVGAVFIDPLSKGNNYQDAIFSDYHIPGLKRLTDAMHGMGVKLAIQLQHRGKQTSSIFTCRQPVAPSSIRVSRALDTGFKGKGDIPRELSAEEIKGIVRKFADAAYRAKEAGFDMIHVHGGHGYLISQFVSPHDNHRTDEYGGSLENRVRFPLEIISAIRKVVGPDTPIGYRISCDEFIDGGMTLSETMEVLPFLEEAGVALLDVSAGVHESVIMQVQPMEVPLGCLVDMAAVLKSNTSIPVSVVGRINDPQLAENILAEGKADFITVARAVHADPEFLQKAKDGRVDDIRTCVGCLQGCMDKWSAGEPIQCLYNAAAGREGSVTLSQAPRPLSVMVVGGGPAGMEAARVAKLRGHNVSLYEKEEELGGQLNLAAKVPISQEIGDVIRYLGTQIDKLGVEIHLGHNVTMDTIKEANPQVLIIATGGKPYLPQSIKVDEKPVATVFDVLKGKVTISTGENVLVMGGDWRGCQVAEMMAERGANVRVVEVRSNLSWDFSGIRSNIMLERMQKNQNITSSVRTTLEGISDGKVILQHDGDYEYVECDLIVFSLGVVSDNSLVEELYREGINSRVEIKAIGDCVVPRTVLEAIRDGFDIGREV